MIYYAHAMIYYDTPTERAERAWLENTLGPVVCPNRDYLRIHSRAPFTTKRFDPKRSKVTFDEDGKAIVIHKGMKNYLKMIVSCRALVVSPLNMKDGTKRVGSGCYDEVRRAQQIGIPVWVINKNSQGFYLTALDTLVHRPINKTKGALHGIITDKPSTITEVVIMSELLKDEFIIN